MRLLIEHATVWDGSGTAPFPGQVLIEGERIVAVAPAAQATWPPVGPMPHAQAKCWGGGRAEACRRCAGTVGGGR